LGLAGHGHKADWQDLTLLDAAGVLSEHH